MFLVSVTADESEAEDVDKMEDAPVIPDGPCLILCMDKSFWWTRLKPLWVSKLFHLVLLMNTCIFLVLKSTLGGRLVHASYISVIKNTQNYFWAFDQGKSLSHFAWWRGGGGIMKNVIRRVSCKIWHFCGGIIFEWSLEFYNSNWKKLSKFCSNPWLVNQLKYPVFMFASYFVSFCCWNRTLRK